MVGNGLAPVGAGDCTFCLAGGGCGGREACAVGFGGFKFEKRFASAGVDPIGPPDALNPGMLASRAAKLLWLLDAADVGAPRAGASGRPWGPSIGAEAAAELPKDPNIEAMRACRSGPEDAGVVVGGGWDTGGAGGGGAGSWTGAGAGVETGAAADTERCGAAYEVGLGIFPPKCAAIAAASDAFDGMGPADNTLLSVTDGLGTEVGPCTLTEVGAVLFVVLLRLGSNDASVGLLIAFEEPLMALCSLGEVDNRLDRGISRFATVVFAAAVGGAGGDVFGVSLLPDGLEGAKTGDGIESPLKAGTSTSTSAPSLPNSPPIKDVYTSLKETAAVPPDGVRPVDVRESPPPPICDTIAGLIRGVSLSTASVRRRARSSPMRWDKSRGYTRASDDAPAPFSAVVDASEVCCAEVSATSCCSKSLTKVTSSVLRSSERYSSRRERESSVPDTSGFRSKAVMGGFGRADPRLPSAASDCPMMVPFAA